jgi:tetratricopeptide (TPR) repeat protein
MIVRDEASMLARCLDSVIPWVDEVIVVDTGSEDDTVEIARTRGACIGEFAWCDDFAAARNVSIEMATGDWILCLDADEAITTTSGPWLRQLVSEGRSPAGRARAYTVLVRSETAHGTTEDMQSRLWENVPGVRFRGAIHESIEASPDVSLTLVSSTSVVVEHLGYRPEVMELRQKLRRNSTMLAAAIEADPEDAYLRYKAAQHALMDGEYATAVQEGEAALRISSGGSASRGPLGPSNVADTYRTLIAAHLALGDVVGAVRVGDRGVQACPDHAPLRTQYGLALLAGREPARALDAFREARSRREAPLVGAVDRASVGWRALYGMGEAYLELGRPADARTALTQALIDVPGNVVVTRALALAEEGAGDLQSAYDRLDAAVRRHPLDVELRRALAGLLRRAGEGAEAVRILAPLLDAESLSAEVYDDLALALDAAGETADAENARQIAQRLREGTAVGGVDGEGDQ